MVKCCWTIGCLLQVFFLWIASATSAEPIRFVDDRFADFVQGTFDDGGHNLYVARNGSLRTINRFDLNGDGYLDVLFNCTHDTYQMLPATVGTVGADRRTRCMDLAFEGTQRAVLHDLNRDGYLDVVACPNPIGVHHDRRFVMIAWGGPNGWDSQRINTPLPMNAAVMAEVADLNQDGWPDIVVLGAHRWQPDQPEGRIIRIYWGSETGFSVTERHDLGVASAIDMSAADFDGDGARDLAVLGSDGHVTLFWSTSATDGNWAPVSTQLTLPLTGVRCLVAADVDGDATADLVIGSDGTTESTSPASASGGIITVVAGHGERRWGAPEPMEAFPATHITAEDLDNDGHIDLVLTQFDQARAAGGEQAGAGKETADSIRILWGGPEGFDPQRYWKIPFHSGYEASAADLNANGFPDLIVLNSGHAGEHSHVDPTLGANILWGGPEGLENSQQRTVLHEHFLGTSSVVDLNRDGWLDLVSGSYNDPVSGHRDMGLVIFWGGPQGYRHSDAQWLPGFSPLGRTIADLDGDGFLDLFSPQHSGELTREDLACHIYWGSPSGFATRHRTTLFGDSVNDSMAADFNGDGLIDLAVNSHTRHGDHRTQSKIFYNDGKRFTQPTIQHLPTNGPHLMWATDVGHIYHRKYEHAFTSRVLTWEAPSVSGTIHAKATLPTGSRLDLAIRTAESAGGLGDQSWTPVVDGGEFPVPVEHRCAQYHATLVSDNGDRYPVVSRIEVELHP